MIAGTRRPRRSNAKLGAYEAVSPGGGELIPSGLGTLADGGITWS